MVGITSYGAYIPYNRLQRKRIGEAFGKAAIAGEKAVANYDEDSITMAVAAALDCCKNEDISALSGLYFSSTSAPYKEKQCATVISGALDMDKAVRTADFSGSLRCGSEALLAALDAAQGGQRFLVATSDCRLPYEDGQNEMLFGDGAAAVTIGNGQDVLAEVIGQYSYAADFHDQWRSEGNPFVHSWEERFALTQAFEKFVLAAAKGVFQQTGLEPSDFSKVIIYAHTERYQKDIAKKLGFQPGQVQDGLFAELGDTGCSAALLMLAGALETAKPGDKILLLNYSEGCDALAFRVTDAILDINPRPGITKQIANKRNTINYEKYLRWRNLLTVEPPRRPKQHRSSLPDYYRNAAKNLALYGSRCTECGTPQFPNTRVCIKCQSIDKMEPYRFYGRKAVVKTFTVDYLAASQDPPNMVVVVDFEGGGRMFCNIVDIEPEQIVIGMEVDMVFRLLFTEDGIHTYYWKAIAKQKGGN